MKSKHLQNGCQGKSTSFFAAPRATETPRRPVEPPVSAPFSIPQECSQPPFSPVPMEKDREPSYGRGAAFEELAVLRERLAALLAAR